MDEKEIIQKVKAYVKEKYSNETSGHDYDHLNRVYQMAIKINQTEKANEFIITMIAYLHDVFDHKFYPESEQRANLIQLLKELRIYEYIKQDDLENVLYTCENISFKNRKREILLSREGKIVQDADRLDALGAIAIARTFQYGGSVGNVMYRSNEKELQEGESSKGRSSFAHLSDKVLKVKELLNTDIAKQIAEERHQYVEEYIKEFLAEWEGLK